MECAAWAAAAFDRADRRRPSVVLTNCEARERADSEARCGLEIRSCLQRDELESLVVECRVLGERAGEVGLRSMERQRFVADPGADPRIDGSLGKEVVVGLDAERKVAGRAGNFLANGLGALVDDADGELKENSQHEIRMDPVASVDLDRN